MLPVPQASTILASVGQAAFVWDLAADTIAWSDNIGSVLTDIPLEALASGAGFATLIEPTRSIRFDALLRTAPARNGEGAPYRIEYGVRISTAAPVIWIEETGCWFAEADGKPARAQGIIRINNERRARDEQLMGTGPIPASRAALKKAGWNIGDLDLIEANEAFAAQACAVNKDLGWDTNKVNVNGGAIAIGHPIGASGARVLVTLLHEMQKRNAKKGLATLCIGGGMGIALCVER